MFASPVSAAFETFSCFSLSSTGRSEAGTLLRTMFEAMLAGYGGQALDVAGPLHILEEIVGTEMGGGSKGTIGRSRVARGGRVSPMRIDLSAPIEDVARFKTRPS